MIHAKSIHLDYLLTLEQFSFSGTTILFYKLDNEEEIPVGYATTFYHNGILTIHEMEMLYQNKGYGTKAVQSLIKLFPGAKVIEGISLDESVRFWSKFNTEFFETCETCVLKDTEDCPLFENNEVCDEYTEHNFKITLNDKGELDIY